ncbi:MAG: caspase family protein [Pseudomonadota bacterium]
MLAQSRIALVVGNSSYSEIASLKNPRNDAKLMSSTLEKVGFEVISVIDADLASMRKAMTEFGRKLRNSGAVGLFYYAGHGVQLDGENFLIPTDAAIQDETELSWQALRINDFLRVMRRDTKSVNIVILDACRNNPFPSKTRSKARGLTRVTAPQGTYIAYATSPDEVAQDGDTGNSPYTLALSTAISTPGLTIEETFKAAREEVLRATNDSQLPWETSSLVGMFHFTPPDEMNIAALQAKLREQRKLIDELKRKKQQSAALNPNALALGEACDQLAANPYDNRLPGTGVDYRSLFSNAPAAVEACRAAAKAFDEVDRYKYQLGRALSAQIDGAAQAAHWYRKAAEGYYPPAMNALGVILNYGHGVAKDDDEAFKWISQSAEKGYPPAMTNLGALYLSGRGTKRDFLQSQKWYRKAAEATDPLGMVGLSWHYSGGLGPVTDRAEALAWLDKAEKLGEPEAMFQKFLFYSEEGDTAASYRYARMAAQQGHRAAALNQASRLVGSAGIKEVRRVASIPFRFDRPGVEKNYVTQAVQDTDSFVADYLMVSQSNFSGADARFVSNLIKRLKAQR